MQTRILGGSGRNEQLVGRALVNTRNEAIIATKLAVMRDSNGQNLAISRKPEYVKAACDATLKGVRVNNN